MVELLWYTPYEVLMKAIRVSHASLDKLDTEGNALGSEDLKLLQKIIKKHHDSVLEHVVYSFYITDISRALLQELVRHRFVSFTVQSTRYTLAKKLKNNATSELCIKVDDLIDNHNKAVIDFIKQLTDYPNDYLKYLIPEAFKTELVMTTNARELAHIIELRSQPNVLWEFQELVAALQQIVYDVHPELWGLLKWR